MDECWEEALNAADAGDAQRADRYFAAVYETNPYPAAGLRLGERLEKRGRLIEAAACYREVSQVDLSTLPDVSANSEMAKEKAKDGHERLRKGIPALTLRIVGARAQDVEVFIDDQMILDPSTPQRVNPGIRVVRARYQGQEVTKKVTLAFGGGVREVKMEFKVQPQPPPPDPDVDSSFASERIAEGAPPVPPPPERERPQVRERGRRLYGPVALSIGGAGVAIGTILAILAEQDRSKLEEACPNHECEPNQWDAVDRYRNEAVSSYVGFAVGVVGAATGVALLTVPLVHRPPARMGPWFGPSQAGVWGSF